MTTSKMIVPKKGWHEDNKSTQENVEGHKELKNLYDYEMLFGVTKTPLWQMHFYLSYWHEVAN